ncbi:MAG: PepSY domain-containing protein [Betaproteobacteria bacterium]|nr:PepSY domain-containing protein [Betaproteobacteria bacterium]
MRSRKTVILGAVAAVALASSLVYAASGMNEEQNDAAALAQAKISLVQAIAAAEQHVGGKAASAQLEDENGRLVYGVEVIRDGTASDVKVDIAEGKVLSVQSDANEHEGVDEREGRADR